MSLNDTVNQSVILEKHLPAPNDEEFNKILYTSFNKPLSKADFGQTNMSS